jgi:hypothetical protein
MTRPTTGFPELPAAGGPVRRARRAHRAVFSAAGTEPTAFCPEQARCPHPADLNRPSGRGRRGCTAYVPHAVVVSRQARSSPPSRRPSRCHPAKLLARSPFRRAAPIAFYALRSEALGTSLGGGRGAGWADISDGWVGRSLVFSWVRGHLAFVTAAAALALSVMVGGIGLALYGVGGRDEPARRGLRSSHGNSCRHVRRRQDKPQQQ